MISKECQEALDIIEKWSEEIRAFGGDFDVTTTRVTGNLIPSDSADDKEIFKANGVTAAWICDKNADPDRRMLYLHGGGYITGDLSTTRPFARLISKETGCALLIIEYSLSPEEPFPCALDDTMNAYTWLLSNGPDGASSPERKSIAGDSAGGGLALAAMLKMRDSNIELPDCAVTLSAFTDLTLSGESMKSRAGVDPVLYEKHLQYCSDSYAPGEDKMNPYISPVFGDMTGLPPIFMQVGDREILLDDSLRFAKNARTAGVDVTLDVWPEMFHSWQLHAPQVPESQEALERAGRFVKKYC